MAVASPGKAQKAPGKRGKNTNSTAASGTAYRSWRADSRSSVVAGSGAPPPRPRRELALNHRHKAYTGKRHSCWRSRHAANNRNRVAPLSTRQSRKLRASKSFAADMAASKVAPAARPLSVR